MYVVVESRFKLLSLFSHFVLYHHPAVDCHCFPLVIQIPRDVKVSRTAWSRDHFLVSVSVSVSQ